MASLAAQDRYLQGLARRAGVRHSPERPQPRKRKPGEGRGGGWEGRGGASGRVEGSRGRGSWLGAGP